jgi:hypothetical protein
MNRVNRAAARFTLRTGSAGSKGVMSGVSLARGSAIILSAAKDLSCIPLAPALKKTKTVFACAA